MATAISAARVGSGTWASSAWRTIGASMPSMSSRTPARSGSARSGASAVGERRGGGHALSSMPRPPAAAGRANGLEPRRAIGTAAGLFSGLFGVGGGASSSRCWSSGSATASARRPARRSRRSSIIAGRRDAGPGRLRQRPRRRRPARRPSRGRRRRRRDVAAAARPGPHGPLLFAGAARGRRRSTWWCDDRARSSSASPRACVAGLLGVGGGVLFVPGADRLPRPQPGRRRGDLAAGDHPGGARRAPGASTATATCAGATAGSLGALAVPGAIARRRDRQRRARAGRARCAFAGLMLVIAWQMVRRSPREET